MTYHRFMNFVQAPNGDRMWFDSRQCPHFNENCCAFCDFDRFYATKHGAACPWSDE